MLHNVPISAHGFLETAGVIDTHPLQVKSVACDTYISVRLWRLFSGATAGATAGSTLEF